MSVVNSLDILLGLDAKGVQTGARASKKELTSLGSEAKKIWNDTRTPQELYEQRLTRLAGHLRQGTIDQETFARSVRQASVALGEQGKGSGEGFGEGAAALDAYRDRMEQLTKQLAAGKIGQGQFASASGEAAAALAKSGGATHHAAAAHHAAASAEKQHAARLEHLKAALHSGQIDFREYTHRVHEADEAMERAAHSAERMERVVELGKLALESFGVALTAEFAFDFLKESIGEAEKAAASLRRLETVVRASGGAAGVATEEMAEYAEQLEHLTGIDHTKIEGVETILATHKGLKGENFKKATETTLDLAALLGGDVNQAANKLGRLLEDPVNNFGVLTREGIEFNDVEKEIITGLVEQNRLGEAQTKILAKTGGAVHGLAAASKTLGMELGVLWGQFKEGVGSGFGAAPWLKEHLSFLDFTKHPEAESEPKEMERPADLETKQHREARKEIDKVVAALKQEAEAEGKVGVELAIAKGKRQGLTDAELSEAKALSAAAEARKREAAALAEQKKQIDGLVAAAKQLRQQQSSANEHFGESADEAKLADQERAIDREIAKRQKAAEALQDIRGRGVELSDEGQQRVKEYEDLLHAKEDLRDARKSLAERQAKERTKSDSEKLAEDVKALHAGTRTPKEELEDEMAKLRDLHDRAQAAGKYTPELDADLHRKSDELRQKYAELDQPEQKSEEHKETPAALKDSAEAYHSIVGANDVAQKTRQQMLAELRRGNQLRHDKQGKEPEARPREEPPGRDVRREAIAPREEMRQGHDERRGPMPQREEVHAIDARGEAAPPREETRLDDARRETAPAPEETRSPYWQRRDVRRESGHAAREARPSTAGRESGQAKPQREARPAATVVAAGGAKALSKPATPAHAPHSKSLLEEMRKLRKEAYEQAMEDRRARYKARHPAVVRRL